MVRAWSGTARLMAACALALLSPLRGGAGPSRDARAFSALAWVRTDPLHPRLLYAGGYGYRASYPGIQGRVCLVQTARSLDAGATWQDLARSLPRSYSAPYSLEGPDRSGCGAAVPLTPSSDGVDVFYVTPLACTTPDSCALVHLPLNHSGDAGLHWGQPLDKAEQDAQLSDTSVTPEGLSFSPLAPRRVFVVLSSANVGPLVLRSDDGGSTWHFTLADVGATADGHPLQGLIPATFQTVPDPTNKDVVYLGDAYHWLRSSDDGHIWHFMVLPVDLPPGGTALGTDPRLPGLLVVRPVAPGIPPDRRYVSADHGGTWRAIVCPGDLRGECPALVLDNVFGAGKAYGFYADGVHAFIGGGAGGPRLALSARLPCATKDRLYVAGGRTAGDPAYLLCRAPLAAAQVAALPAGSQTTQVGALYRSADAGKSWQRLDPASAWHVGS